MVVDWEQIDPAYKQDIAGFIDKFADALHYDDKELWLCVQPGQELDYIDFENLSDNVDRFVAMLFDETSDIDSPGPLGSRSWFEGWLHVLLEDSDTKRWIIALGSYGYDWTIGEKKAELITFPEAMSRAHNAQVDGAEIKAPSYNPYFYFEDGDKEHAVWFLDVVTFLNELREVRDQKAGGFALYRLGSEDPAIWDALSVPRDFKIDNQTRQSLEVLEGTDTITDVGEGEIVTVDESRSDGRRNLAVDPEGYLTGKYVKFPEFPTLYHQGAGGEHQVAITFDDGPDPRWTPKILDILKAANVKAAFFLVGVNAERYPGLVRRIVDEGHEIGNHTYYHPNLALCWPEHVRLELNATQLLLETITGRATTLFRPPYAADTDPSQLSELAPLQIAQELNYLVVLESIDPQDWAKPGADIILRRVKQQRRGRRSLADCRGTPADFGLVAHSRRHDRAVEHADWNHPRCAYAASSGERSSNGANCEQHGISYLSRNRRISLGVHDRRNRARSWANACRDLACVSISTKGKGRLCGANQRCHRRLQRRESDRWDVTRAFDQRL